jgi:small subunit ribosomal protein S8
MTDPIADMLTRIRNAVHARHTRVDMPASKLKVEIARILRTRATSRASSSSRSRRAAGQGPRAGDARVPEVRPARRAVITGIERVSRPGRRVYFGRDDVPPVLGGLGTSILTTSRA